MASTAAVKASPYKALVKAQWTGWKRDKANVFFSLLFPLIMMALLSLIFGGAADSTPRVLVAGDVPALEGYSGDDMDVESVDGRDEAIERIEDNRAGAAVVQEGDSVTVYYSENPSSGPSARNAVEAALAAENADLVKEEYGIDPPVAVDSEAVSGSEFDMIQFLAPGMLAWAIAIAGVFNTAGTLVDWKRTKILRRLRITPAGSGVVVGSRITVNVVVACIQVAVFLAAAVAVFGYQMSGWAWFAVPLAILGTAMFISMGVIIGGIAKTSPGAAGLSNLVTMPMAFTSGAMYPLSESPTWLQLVSYANPMRYLNEAIQGVASFGLSPVAVLPQVGMILAFTAVFAAVAWKTFRFSDL
ncbi:ABC transporter permease [Salininema proteolyticum]|uniref:ABC transporter permease n=1 Tax=Salininema proteolyticum TaxID=1607685 RepID=A0ABV8TYC7_9ACTN